LGIDYPFSLVSCATLVPYRYNHWFVLPAVALATKDSYWYAAGVITIFGFIIYRGQFYNSKLPVQKSLNSFASTSYHFVFDVGEFK
jgi:uncharacterized membrane protein YgdD (TMEM256/DUF423 family)